VGEWIDPDKHLFFPHPIILFLSIQPAAFRHKKTGLVDQGVTEKPGEFSNLVLSGITEYIDRGEY
jgi:hypothetical protein